MNEGNKVIVTSSDTILVTVITTQDTAALKVPIEVLWGITVAMAGVVGILTVLLVNTRKKLNLISRSRQ